MSRKIFLNRTRAKINSDPLEKEVMAQDDELFINRMTELNALWSDLLEHRKSISTLKEQLQCSVGNQLGFEATLDAIEQQLQQEFDKLCAALKPEFSKNVKIRLAANITTAVRGSPHKRARQCDDERSDEEILKVSPDNEQKFELPVGLTLVSEHAMQLDSSPPKKQIRLYRKGKKSSESDAHITKVNQQNNSKESNAQVALECQLAEEASPQLANFMKQSGETLERRKRQPLLMRKSSETFFKTTRGGRGESTTHSCAECGKTFRRKSILTQHLATHPGEKSYECGECRAAYTQIPSLMRHQRIHSVEKPFTCDICSRSFRLKFYLMEHMNIHSDRKPYECNVCNKTFRQRSALCLHRKVHSDVRE